MITGNKQKNIYSFTIVLRANNLENTYYYEKDTTIYYGIERSCSCFMY